VKAIGVIIPKKIIRDEGKVLDGTVMGRKRIKKKVMSKSLENKEWTLDQGVIAREIAIIPDKLPGKRRRMDEDGAENK
jgi:hypothetical protein